MLAAVATILIGTTTVSAATSAALSRQRLIVDGKTAACELYAIDGSNYIKLRDLAYVLNGTGSQFSVERDEKSTMVSISTGKAYVADGNELSAAIPSYPPTIAKRMPTIQIDGNSVTDLSVYSIGSHDFFKLRELGGLLGFSVDYDAPSDAVIVKSMTTVYVSSAAELLNAIASNTRVVLSAGTYNLSSVNLPAVKNSHITWKTVFDGTEVFVNGVRSCIVSSAAGAASTQVVVEPRYANVLNFSGCSGIKLVNLTVGHTLEPGYCTGGVLHFSDSENVGISSCVLYGCGTYGLILEDVRGLTVRDTEIKECTYGIMTAASSSSLFFLNSRFHDCEGYTMMTLDNCKKAVFDGVHHKR